MKTPELGSLDLHAYEEEKKYIVRPDRMCVGAVYSLMLFLGPGQSPEAYVLPRRITDIEQESNSKNKTPREGVLPFQLNNAIYRVASYLDWPGESKETKNIWLDYDGHLITRLDRVPSGGYFKHCFDEVESEFEELNMQVSGGVDLSGPPIQELELPQCSMTP